MLQSGRAPCLLPTVSLGSEGSWADAEHSAVAAPGESSLSLQHHSWLSKAT